MTAGPPSNPGKADADLPREHLELAQRRLIAGDLGAAEAALARAEAVARQSAPHGREAFDSRLAPLRRDIADRMAQAYLGRDRVLPALGHLELAVALGAGEPSQDLFISLLLQVRFRAPQPSVKPILCRALAETWVEPARLSRFVAALLRLEPDIQAFEAAAKDGRMLDLTSSPATRVMTDPLLLTLLDRALVVDVGLEALLTRMRRSLLERVTSGPPADLAAPIQGFAVALANQAFTTEYVYALDRVEAQEVDDLAARCADQLAAGLAPAALDLAVLAAYRPLHATLDSEALLSLPIDAVAEPLLRRQVREPREEVALRAGLPALTPIREPTSKAVRAQYEEHPYPRWVSPPGRRRRQSFFAWIRAVFPAAELARPNSDERLQGLVAGCGTGQETAGMAQQFENLDLLAVDVSVASLAHAARRAKDLNLDMVTFGRADILEIARLERSFDVVVSAGVLHHLDDPTRGLAALRAVTRPGGVLLVALYSTAARRHLEPARAFAHAGGYTPTAEGLRRFRQDVLAAPSCTKSWRDDLLNRDDFYSLSGLRDLLFHVQETTFDIPRLATMLRELDLRFGGFALDPETMRRFSSRFGTGHDPLSLDQWAVFETEHPDTFWHMYHFLVQVR